MHKQSKLKERVARFWTDFPPIFHPLSTDFYQFSPFFHRFPRYPRLSIVSPDFPLFARFPPDFPRISTDIPAIFFQFPRFSSDFPMIFSNFPPISPEFTRFPPIFPDLPRFSPICPDLPRFPPNFHLVETGFLPVETGDGDVETEQAWGVMAP